MPIADYEVLDPRFARLFNTNAHVEKLFTGCLWAEGPAYFAAGRYLVWSDIPNNRMLRYDETDGQSQRVPPAVAAIRTAIPSIARAGWSVASIRAAASAAPSSTARSPRSPTATRASASTRRTTSS